MHLLSAKNNFKLKRNHTLAALVLFGLLVALLGNGARKVLSWAAMAVQMIVITWKLSNSKK